MNATDAVSASHSTAAERPFPRPRLERLGEQVALSSVTIVWAPPGFGKTTAARGWFDAMRDAGRPSLWLEGRGEFSDLNRFLTAVKAAGVSAGLDWHHLDPIGGAAPFFDALASDPRKPLLLVDDAHFLPGDVLRFLGRFLNTASTTLTVILVTRRILDLPISRARTLGRLVEIGPSELGLETDEARELFERIAGPVPSDEFSKIAEESRGWATGMVIAAQNHRRKGRPGAVYAELSRYFREELLDQQSTDLKHFVSETSILDELTPAACAAVVGTTVEAALDTLEAAYAAGMFLLPLDWERNSFTLHPMLRKTLSRDLQQVPEKVSELHRRASVHFAMEGNSLAALNHAQASGDPDFITEQLELLTNDLIYLGYLYRVAELGSQLSWSKLSNCPMLLLAMAWNHVRHLSFSAAERFIAAAEELAPTRSDGRTITNLVRHRRIMFAAARDDLEYVEEEAEKLLDELGEEGPYLRATLLAQLMSARRERYHFHDFMRLEAETHRVLKRQPSPFSTVSLKFTAAPTFVAQGKTAQARKLLEEALVTAEECHGKGSGLAALPALPLAELIYDLGEVEAAKALVDRYLPVVRHWAFVDQLAAGYLVRAKLAWAQNNPGAALAGLEEAHLVAIECGLDRLRALVVAEQVRIHIKSGHVDAAEAALRAGNIRIEGLPVPSSASTHKDEAIAIAWLRIQMHRENLAVAEKVATRWLEYVNRTAAVQSVVIFQLILTLIAVLRGNRPKAKRSLRSAITMAAPSGWVQIFVDEREWIGPLLLETYTGDPGEERTEADVFAARLAAILRGDAIEDRQSDPDDAGGLASSLSSREIDILMMVNGSMRNREIGERLGLTEGTVKWYLQQVYDKLGVRRRSKAVSRARELSILN